MLENKKVSVKFHKCEGTTHSPMIRWIAGQNAIFNIGGRSAPIQINGVDHSMLLQEISHLPKTQTVLKKSSTEKTEDKHCVHRNVEDFSHTGSVSESVTAKQPGASVTVLSVYIFFGSVFCVCNYVTTMFLSQNLVHESFSFVYCMETNMHGCCISLGYKFLDICRCTLHTYPHIQKQ